MSAAHDDLSKESSHDILSLIAKAVPPAFTIPMLALKAFIANLNGVFVLGCLLAIGMFFHPAKGDDQVWYRRVLTVVTCLAWLLIFNETAANYIFNKYILGNDVDDHTYLIRFTAGAIIVFRLMILGFHAQVRTKKHDSATKAGNTEPKIKSARAHAAGAKRAA